MEEKRDQGDAERGGKGKEQWGAEEPGRSRRTGARRRGGLGKWPTEGGDVAGAERAAAGGARGRGLISISNGCEMRLAPLEAVRV